jgi:hypothetical protein
MKTASSPAARPALADLHHAHVRRCLDLLQQARLLCLAAAEALCPVPGFGNEWSHLVGYDAVKGDWHLVAGRLDEMITNARRGRCPSCGGKLPEACACDRCGFLMPPATPTA